MNVRRSPRERPQRTYHRWSNNKLGFQALKVFRVHDKHLEEKTLKRWIREGGAEKGFTICCHCQFSELQEDSEGFHKRRP